MDDADARGFAGGLILVIRVGQGKGGVLGDAWKSKQLLIAAGVAAAIIAGAGAAAQAGLLSRAESDGEHSRGAGAAIGSAETGDVVAVAETNATWDEESNASASATLLRVGDTKIGEAPNEEAPTDVLGPLLDGQPTEAFVDGGCNDGLEPPTCVYLLGSVVDNDTEAGDVNALYSVAGVRIGTTGVSILNSQASQFQCSGEARGSLAEIVSIQNPPQFTPIDPSEAEAECPPPPQ